MKDIYHIKNTHKQFTFRSIPDIANFRKKQSVTMSERRTKRTDPRRDWTRFSRAKKAHSRQSLALLGHYNGVNGPRGHTAHRPYTLLHTHTYAAPEKHNSTHATYYMYTLHASLSEHSTISNAAETAPS